MSNDHRVYDRSNKNGDGKVHVYSSKSTEIIIVELILLTIGLSYLLITKTDLHNAFSIILSCIGSGILFAIWKSKIGFWIVSLLFSSCWGYFAGNLADGFIHDIIWTYVIGIIVFLISFGSHSRAKDYYDNVAE